MNNNQIPSVSPEVTFIDDLVSNIEMGRVVLPEFQRPYVWRREDIKNLFDSIYKGYPIGSILLWDGGGKDIPFLNNMGGRLIPKVMGEKYYIVDGQQRLTTLFCCLSDELLDDDGKWDLYFNLKNDTFTYSVKKDGGSQHHISIRSIRKTTSFLKEARRILEESGDDSLVEKAEYLADKIRKYKMAVIKLDGGSLEEVVEVFSRLNSLGKNIGQQDLVYALTYTGDSSSRVNYFINEVRDCFYKYVEDEKNNNEIYLQLIKTAIGFEIYDKDRNRLVERLKDIDKNERYKLDEIISSLERTLSYVVNVLGINKISLFPYTNQLFMIFHYFHTGHKTSTLENLSNWFFLISIFGLGRASPSKVEKIILFFKNGLKKEELNQQLYEALNVDSIPKLGYKYSASSASGKTTSIILNKYLSNVIGCGEDGFSISDYSVFPPKNMFKSFFNDRLGGKNFYLRNKVIDPDDVIYNKIEGIIPNESIIAEGMGKDDIVMERERVITEIYEQFGEQVMSKLRKDYLN
ncbi:hypothetical protein SMQE22_02220 [Serratia marcescens]|nr:hypothetical protein SMQE22_02220 [Serratia marcescens]